MQTYFATTRIIIKWDPSPSMEKSGRLELVWENLVLTFLKQPCSNSIALAVMYHQTSSRGPYGHDPFWSVFEEYPQDLDSTMRVWFEIWIVSFWISVVESIRCSSKSLQKRSCPYAPLDEALWYVNGQYGTDCTTWVIYPSFHHILISCSRKCRGSGDIKPG